MFRPLTSETRSPNRRGALLIAVLGLLTLFAIFALFFVFYADAEATGARIAREKEAPGEVGPPNDYAQQAFNLTLGSLLFDAPDVGGVLNPLRGLSLARSMYGFTGTAGASAPFSGLGTLHNPAPHGADSALWINFSSPYTVTAANATMQFPAGTYVLDPEWTGNRNTNQGVNWLSTPPGAAGQTYIPKNAPYTYPDLKDLILASLSPATGEVLVKSLHRDWLFNAGNPNVQFRLAPWNPSDIAVSTNTAANTDWVTPEGRTKVLRPRPVDQLVANDFLNPPPSDLTDTIPSGPSLQYPFALPYVGGNLPYPIQPNLGGYSAAQLYGLYNRIQQRIAQGRIIAYPPINADGLVTGDVQNLQGSVGVQKNDSILIDIGLPPRQWNGKWIKPLAAVLVSDLDGLLNVNAHGNIRNGNNHGSYAGYGPHEVNLGLALGNAAEANAMVNLRTSAAPTARNGATTLYYDRSGNRIPAYSQVNFDGAGAGPMFTLPSFPTYPLQTSPTFSSAGPGAFYDDNFFDNVAPDTYNKYQNHPLLWNPNDWPAQSGPTPRTFALSDIKRFNFRYAADRDWYTQTDLFRAGQMNTSLIGSPSTPANYRLDSAHLNRGLVTMRSTSLDLPGLPGNFNTSTGVGPFVLGPGQIHPTNPAFAGTFAAPVTPVIAGADFNSPNDLRNTNKAALGPIDLNRPLTDYRSDPNVPLGQASVNPPGDATNTANYLQAWADRHNLARDIFARLIVATGANASINSAGDVAVTVLPGTPDYNALRYLAQLAANMVDTIDNDDISTLFVWNPISGALTVVDTSANPSNVQTFVNANTTTPTEIQNRVVFGVEKPRLVLNEVYSEVTNNPMDTAAAAGTVVMQDAHVRFWVELVNPTAPNSAGAPGTPVPAVGNGSVSVRSAAPGVTPYQLVITRAQKPPVPGNASDLLRNPNNPMYPSNVTGDLPPMPFAADISFDFSTAPMAPVTPNNGAYSGAGFLVCGPSVATPHAIQFQPDTTNPPWDKMVAATGNPGTPTALAYTTQLPMAASLEAPDMGGLKHHVVLLRRLANPYMGASQTNPYVTVDVVDHVPAFDAVHRAATMPNDRTPKTDWVAPGYVGYNPKAAPAAGMPDVRPYAVGKVQPYTSFANRAVPPDVQAGEPWTVGVFPRSFVIRQETVQNENVKYTFFRHNGRNAAQPGGPTVTPALPAPTTGLSDTIMAPFDWFVHFDRPIVNPLELLSLQATKPHEVTQYSIRPNGASILRDSGLAPWLGINPMTNQPGWDMTNQRTNNGLYRAMDTLRVKSWIYGAGLGGKVHGKININTIQDLRILQAMLDANDFGGVGNGFSSAQVSAVWTGMFNPSIPVANVPYRTATYRPVSSASGITANVPLPDRTYDDVADPVGVSASLGRPLDRPFRSLGAAEFAPDGTNMSLVARYGSGLQDTLLRVDPNGSPLLSVPGLHPYMQAELARKMFNNATTTSNAFAISVTIVFHEVRLYNGLYPMSTDDRTYPPTNYPAPLPLPPPPPPAGTRYLIGKEAYKDVPGDLRQQFYAIVDRSNLGLVPGTINLQPNPFFGALNVAPVVGVGGTSLYLDNQVAGSPGVFYADGKIVPSLQFGVGTTIAVGVGSNQEFVNISAINPDGSLLVLGLTKTHTAGELVANSVTGNPGPQPLFDYRNAFYSGVVPYAKRVK